MSFKSAFSRESSFQWFVVVVIGLIISNDGIGVTSIVRELSLNPKYYENLIHFFRSDAWKIDKLIERWVSIIKANAPIIKVKGLNILIGDGVKQSKEGKRMPGVKKYHQDSENSAKAEYIFGHMFGVVSVLIGNMKKQFSLAISATIQDGVNEIRKYTEPLKEVPSHVVQVIAQAGDIAKQLGKSILLLDRYFLSVPALEKALEYLDENGDALIEIVTKAKISYKAYKEPEAPTHKKAGAPKKKGDSVKLKDLFITAKEKFITTDLYLYGKMQTVEYYCTDLLWGTKLYKKLRFVLVKAESFPESIFVSTSLMLSAEEIIGLYSYRFKIELNFKVLKHTIYGFCYHFWSKYMPKLNRYQKERNQRALETITDKFSQKKIIEALKAIEGHVMFSCIACGIVQMISLKFSEIINFSQARWLRTITNSIVSEDTVVYYLKKNIFSFIKEFSHYDIMQIIISKQDEYFEKYSKSA